MPSIDARIAALASVLQRRQMEQAAPVDPLSASLFEMGRELAALLDEQGKVALLEALNNPNDGETDSLNLTLEDIDRMIADYGRKDEKP